VTAAGASGGPARGARWPARAAHAVGLALAAAAGVALFALMLLTFVDVMGRKFFVSVPGALELSEMLMVVVVFSGLPLVARHGEHVRFELVDPLYRGRAAGWSRCFSEGFCALAVGALAFATWRFAGRTMADGEVSIFLKWPVGAFVYLMAVLLALAALMHLLRAAGVIRAEGSVGHVEPTGR
jgi:TRAP-type C4-dicarboxylate transport system permease small subunit